MKLEIVNATSAFPIIEIPDELAEKLKIQGGMTIFLPRFGIELLEGGEAQQEPDSPRFDVKMEIKIIINDSYHEET